MKNDFFFVNQQNRKFFVAVFELWSWFFFLLDFLHFQFNFVGKILGPQGNTIKRLQEETGAKISVLGKGSMRDKAKVRKKPKIYFMVWELVALQAFY